MCLEFDFTYAVQISSRSVNPLSYYIYIYIYIYIYMKTIIVISRKINQKSKNRIQFYICCTNFIRIGEQIRDAIVTSRGVVIIQIS